MLFFFTTHFDLFDSFMAVILNGYGNILLTNLNA